MDSSRSSPESDPPVTSDAHAAIHSMFAYERWQNLSAEDFELLEEVLNLASRILLCGRALHFWHAIAYGPKACMYDQYNRDQGCFCRKFKDSSKPLPSGSIENVKKLLEEVSKSIVLSFEKIYNKDSYRALGDCQGDRNKTIRVNPHGVGSRIRIEQGLLDELRIVKNELKGALAAEAEVVYRRMQLSIAITIIHEISHAMYNAIEGVRAEMFFENDTFAEVGRALEKWLFGGRVPHWSCQYGDRPLCILRIPIIGDYPHIPYSTKTKEFKGPASKEISDTSIIDLFTEAFWKRDDIQSGARLLKGFR